MLELSFERGGGGKVGKCPSREESDREQAPTSTGTPHSPQRTHGRGVPGEEVLAVGGLVVELGDPLLHQRVTVEEDGGRDRFCLIFPAFGGRGKHHIQIPICQKGRRAHNTATLSPLFQ